MYFQRPIYTVIGHIATRKTTLELRTVNSPVKTLCVHSINSKLEQLTRIAFHPEASLSYNYFPEMIDGCATLEELDTHTLQMVNVALTDLRRTAPYLSDEVDMIQDMVPHFPEQADESTT